MIDLLEKLRIRLAGLNAQPLLALLGLLSGLLSGMIIILFRKTIELTQVTLLPIETAENFESLSLWWRFLVPVCGGVLLALLLYSFSRKTIRFGVVHVMERLAYFEGNMPFRNMVLQFVGATVALVSGQSVGREGPGVHLGAAASSLLGQYLQLPNNSLRTLIACGTAAAIAASFNTPLTGVIFAMEVVMMEYTISGFTPVILAAVSATVLTRWFYGSEPTFSVPPLELYSMQELPIVLMMGLSLGALAAVFSSLLQWVTTYNVRFSVWNRMLLAGTGVGLCAILVPEIMGIGYDTVNKAFNGNEALGLLLIVVLFKIIATSISIGAGVPGGLIGPTLFIGATAGSAFGLLVAYLPMDVSHPGLYAMLGMGAMMGACLQAPLAALVTLLELTANPYIILPGMLAIVSATLTSKEMFSKDSIFLMQIRAIGLDYRNDPLAQSLRRIGVASVMDRQYATTTKLIDRDQAMRLLKDAPRWLIIEGNDTKLIMPAADLARYLEDNDNEQIDMIEIPSTRRQMAPIHLQATLQEAKETLEKTNAEVLFVSRPIAPMVDRIYGVIDREIIEKGYRY